MATNATCLPTSTNFSTPVTLSVMATVNFPLPTTAACNWYWQSYSASMTGNFSITGPMDGLPVELLEFSVVED
ncbi:MAG: hypothetical protein DHS20C11_14610 [Lysobacteraceae bacterium]|nr:MAG: hypothetical protein DHS20C11_14610 [Xanthomonadaceae bacterium]